MVFHAVQSNFSGGEVSPHLYPRVDVPSYTSWLKTACNFFVHPQGGASNRCGTAYINQAKYSDKNCRLIPFVLSEEEAYVLELGEQYIRVHAPAGTLLKEGLIYEIPSPYLAKDLDLIHYVQYDQTLFLVHSEYFPKKLIRTEDGFFTLQDLQIKDGPFMLANTDESKKARLWSKSETVVSEGVKASLSFLPIIYPNCFIQAYWRGERFYDPSGFGFNINEVVQAFNLRCSSSGCIAFNQGGVLRIESPQQTGGSHNGAQLVIEYREALLSAPKLIVTQTMSGGSNAGEVISSGEEKLYLQTDFDFFRPGQVGGLFALNHRIESFYETGTLGYNGVSAIIKTGGDWRLRTTGNWFGEVVLESSEDGQTWNKVKHFTKAQDEDNISTLGNLELSAKMRYLRLRCLGISGEMGYILQSDAFMQEGIVKLESYVSPREMLVSVQRQPGDMQQWTSDWAEGSFHSEAGFPSCVFFYQDRLGFAGSKKEPQTIWFSKTGEYENFGYLRTLEDSDAISLHLSSKKLNAIHSVAVGSKLLIFTAGSEWSLGCNGALTPYNIEIAQEGERGASKVAPLVVGNRTLYVQSRGGVLRDFFYDYSSDCYTGRDLTLRAKHLFFNKEIKALSYQQEPDNLIWCVLNDGSLLSLTYLAEEEMWAWSKHQTQGKFLSVCCIPSRGYDETWFLTQRNGVCFIERMLARMPSKAVEDQIFLDCSVSQKSNQPFSQMSGLEHLEGQKVVVLADGNPLMDVQVKDGKISFQQPVCTAHVGLSYQAQLETLPVSFETSEGSMQDRRRRLVKITLKMLDSRGGEAGASGGKLDPLYPLPSEVYGQAAPLQTREFCKVLSSAHSVFPAVTFVQKDPFPVTVLAVVAQIC
ncbi:MAG: hypothetical protein IKL48_01360 [Elusimicrobiaceae bacterium]|nr:hypothetical protein [Elusimicrobiaceae bacterium]